MKARILPKSEEKLWDTFLQKNPLANIHQSPNWGHFQQKIPYHGKYWIIVLEENNKIIGGSMIIRRNLPKGFTWLYASRGPILDYQSPELNTQIQELLKTIKKIAKQERSVFFRIDPALLLNDTPPKLKSFHSIPHGFQPECTLMIDLTQSEEEILAQMKQKGRYNIKVAKKKEVEIEKANPRNPKKFQCQISKFYDIFQETTSRDKFSGHNEAYYKHMVEELAKANQADLFLAKFHQKIIAGIIVTYFKDTAIYYYGASSNHHRNVMAPYLLQWTAIQEAKKRGCHKYDFLGIAKSDDPKDPWHGITQFKKKFGGEKIKYQPAQEFALRPFIYWLYRIYKKLR